MSGESVSRESSVPTESKIDDANDDAAQATAELEAFETELEHEVPRIYATPVLIAVNVVVFAVMTLKGADWLYPTAADLTSWGANAGQLTLNGEWWRLVTSMFLHGGLVHLALNMWALYYAGHLVERLAGTSRYLAVYLAAGIAGGLASVAWNAQVVSAGASGAIFGLFGALLAFTYFLDNGLTERAWKVERKSALSFVAYTLVYGYTHHGVDNAAHAGGLVAGFVMGAAIAFYADIRRVHFNAGSNARDGS